MLVMACNVSQSVNIQQLPMCKLMYSRSLQVFCLVVSGSEKWVFPCAILDEGKYRADMALASSSESE